MKQLLLLSFFLFSIISFGQQITVNGKVTDGKTGEPLPGAEVRIYKTNKGCNTDIDGNYVLEVSLNDTLVFSFTGMKSQKIKVDKQEIQVKLFEIDPIHESFDPAYYIRRIKKLEATTMVTKEDIENANNPKYKFKKNAKNNVFVIFVSELTSNDLNDEDLKFEQKYNVKYSSIGNYKNDYLKKYNKLTFKHLKKKFKKSWLSEIRKDAVGLKKE
ncbi:carboxypeptidase-like regulatory domain-containing protein [Flavobacterium cyclinae]|uniref:carboxypeptidase-like regulatory domain-containing protein n=1 Tax=Flavobacterium cyclinae TaxID=2895947 RepID=UPI001E5195AD|nr:carboxypeptidase-like regulatory domain-containing protein [Flavobacterium cyclinae]UGS19808.1 carboxypeptidase-like regulatory domain-containing protein [Flavobacterium cyclinae]